MASSHVTSQVAMEYFADILCLFKTCEERLMHDPVFVQQVRIHVVPAVSEKHSFIDPIRLRTFADLFCSPS